MLNEDNLSELREYRLRRENEMLRELLRVKGKEGLEREAGALFFGVALGVMLGFFCGILLAL